MTELFESQYWRDYAACAGDSGEDFYPIKGDDAAVARAKAVCQSCPVQAECLSTALDTGERLGIWGGYTPEEREAIRVAKNLPRRPPPSLFPHGTEAGFKRHYRAGTVPCRACYEGSVRERRDRSKRKKGRQ